MDAKRYAIQLFSASTNSNLFIATLLTVLHIHISKMRISLSYFTVHRNFDNEPNYSGFLHTQRQIYEI